MATLGKLTGSSFEKPAIVLNKLFGFLIVVFTMVLTGASFAQQKDGMFRASVVKIDITPNDSQWLTGYQARKSTGVHGRMYHRINRLITLMFGVTILRNGTIAGLNWEN